MYKCVRKIINFYSQYVFCPKKLSISVKQTNLQSLSSPPSFTGHALQQEQSLFSCSLYPSNLCFQNLIREALHCNHSGLTLITTETHLSTRISPSSHCSEISAPLYSCYTAIGVCVFANECMRV